MSEAEALAWTYALELPVVLLAALIWRRPLRLAFLAGLLASGLTHPFAWNIALALPEDQLAWGWYVIEAVVVLVESLGLVLALPGRGWRNACTIWRCCESCPMVPGLCPTGIVGGQIKNIFSGKTALAPASPSSLTVSAPE